MRDGELPLPIPRTFFARNIRIFLLLVKGKTRDGELVLPVPHALS